MTARARETAASTDVLALLSAAAELLFRNGETTRRMAVGIERLGATLGIDVAVLPRWDEVTLLVTDATGQRSQTVAATPLGVDMHKVVATNKLIDDICTGRIAAGAAQSALLAIQKLPPVSLARFVILTAAGAAALGVIFGASHWLTLALIALSAGAGAIVRRLLAARGHNPFVQPFCAALLAGVIGAIVVRLQLSSLLCLVAV